MTPSAALRTHVVNLLTARHAHLTFEDAVAECPVSARGQRPEALPYSVWELVEHIRRAQADILDFCRNADYEQPPWPDAFWPDDPAPPDAAAWDDSVAAVLADRDAMCTLVQDPERDLYAQIPHGDGQTYLREALLVADHAAYHVGQIVAVRRALGAWPPEDTPTT
jgi:uncharacterized damage-inducible protein DinB